MIMTHTLMTPQNTKLGLLRAVSQRCLSFKTDNRGVAAIEFAFIAPIMIAMYFGLAEISMAINADRDVSHATNVAGDLATQSALINDAEIEDIMEASLAVMNIRRSRRHLATIELSSFRENLDGSRERIGYARLGPAITKGGATYSASDIDDQLINSTSGVVVARANYSYEPTTFKFMDTTVLGETFTLKPRVSSVIPFDEGGRSNFTCTASATLAVSCTAS